MCMYGCSTDCKDAVYRMVLAFLQVSSCNTCQRNKQKLQKVSGSLRPIPVPSKLWAQLGMDLIGPMPKTPRGNQYIVTLTDYFSKWAEAASLPDKLHMELQYLFGM